MGTTISVVAEPPGLVSRDMISDLSNTLAAAAALIEQDSRWTFGEVTCLLVSVDRIGKLHAEYFDDPSPTDIITFPYADPSSSAVVDGDLAICPDVVREQARDVGVSFRRELAFVGVHGLLHLAGMTDHTDEQREAMHARQIAILDAVADVA